MGAHEAHRSTVMTRPKAALVKAMLARGDSERNIAAFLGLNPLCVRLVQAGCLHPEVQPAPAYATPPPGPYPGHPGYAAMSELEKLEAELEVAARKWSPAASTH